MVHDGTMGYHGVPWGTPILGNPWKRESERGASPLRFALAATDLMGQRMSCAHLPSPSERAISKTRTRCLLVGGWATPLKNMSSSIGMMNFPIFLGKCQKWQPVTTNQTSILFKITGHFQHVQHVQHVQHLQKQQRRPGNVWNLGGICGQQRI